MSDKLSVIIPTMNRPKSLEETLIFIGNSTYLPDELIIVDQSTNSKFLKENEQKIKMIIRDTSIKIKHIILKTPSLTGARNIGIENSSNDILIFMDDDVEVNKDTFYNIYLEMKNSEIAMIGGIDELSHDGKSILGYIFAKKSIKKFKNAYVTKGMFGRYPNNINKVIETEWAMGYFFIVRKSLINKWKICFDEKLISYAYPEDLDFTFTYYKLAKKEGLKSILTPKIKVKHVCSQEYRIPSFKSTCMYVINREYVSYKHFKNPLCRLLTRWANIGEVFRRCIKNENPIDVIKAQYYCDKYRKDIKVGYLHYELYDK